MSYPDNDYRNYIAHSAKGQKWSNHKYLYIDANGNYVYPEDQKPGASKFRSRQVRYTWQTMAGPTGEVKTFKKHGTVRKGNRVAQDGHTLPGLKVTATAPYKHGKGKWLQGDRRSREKSISTDLYRTPVGDEVRLRSGSIKRGRSLKTKTKVGSGVSFKDENFRRTLDMQRIWNSPMSKIKTPDKAKTRPDTKRKKKYTSGSAELKWRKTR